MLFKKRQVLCSSCGFFCWQTQHVSGEGPYKWEEVGQSYREGFQAGKYMGQEEDGEAEEFYHVSCLRRQWVWTGGGSKLRPDYANADDLRKSRRCVYYVSYEPAYGPEEHKELKREAETRRTILISSLSSGLIGALIGATAAIIVRLAIK